MSLKNDDSLNKIVQANQRNIVNDSTREFVDGEIRKASRDGHEVLVLDNHLTDNVVKSLKKDGFRVHRCYESEWNSYYTQIFWGSSAGCLSFALVLIIFLNNL